MRNLLMYLSVLVASAALAANELPPAFKPDPLSVQWNGPAYRYPQAGWTILHIEGEPYERGVQHGKLMWKEIPEYIECIARSRSPKDPSAAWQATRTLANALFLRRFEEEYLHEMQGIADGASATGAMYDGKPLDLVDITALNIWAELMCLDGGLNALPTGLEGIRFPNAGAQADPPPKGEHCSAFAAVGPATADGKIVFGHITMFGLYPCNFFGLWIDVKPAKGHRVFMQSYPGGIQSGMDYYMNSAGILCSETTIAQTRFNSNGKSLSSQIRKALQYSDSIDALVEIMKSGGNGLYTNEWLLADTKTNEIAMFELGTHTSKLYRSSKNEWFGGTPGFYWGCNNIKDREVRLETIASVKGRPENMIFKPRDRDRLWIALYEKHKGKIDAAVGREFFSTPPIAAFSSCDAKVTTTDSAKEMATWAIYGPPLGRSWQPTHDERERYPAIKPLVSNPWAIVRAPQMPEKSAVNAADLGNKKEETQGDDNPGNTGPTKPAWHGTLFPKSDGDIWLAIAFADYERFFSRERSSTEKSRDHCLCEEDKVQSARDLFGARAGYLIAARNYEDTPLSEIKSAHATDTWYRIASGKGFLLLHELRGQLGDKLFAETMDLFGTARAGQEVSTPDFVTHVEKAVGKPMKPFFDFWLNQKGLPRLKLSSIIARGSSVAGTVEVEAGPMPSGVDVTVETANGDVTGKCDTAGNFRIICGLRPLRVIVDKFGRSAIANGAIYSLNTFTNDLRQTLIVYGTQDDAAANAEAAEELQKAIVIRGSNVTVAIRSDATVTEDELKANHVLLIGRPNCNSVSRKFENAVPAVFGPGSIRIGEQVFANAGTCVAVAGENPLNRRYSIVMIAGLSAAATFSAAPAVGRGEAGGEVTIFNPREKTRQLILPARELVNEFGK